MSTTQYDPVTALDDKLKAAGASKTVYALVVPEAEKQLLATVAPDLENAENGLIGTDAFAPWLDSYHAPWTKKQDSAHQEFFKAWREWASAAVTLGERFDFQYPTSGASEGLFHLITGYGNRARQKGFDPVIHIFEGEYEGYPAYAESQSIAVQKHSRADWRKTIGKIGPNDQVYISQPSAIDGNLWPDFEAFADELGKRQPTAEIIADLTYVGAVARDYHINVDKPNIKAVVFSLSKPMGVYYHRIGGILSQASMPSLFGNQWFKNLLALAYGTRLLKTFGVREIPKRYAAIQQQAAAEVTRRLNVPIKGADVMLIGTADATALRASDPAMADYLARAPNDPAAPVRFCLTSAMSRLIPKAGHAAP